MDDDEDRTASLMTPAKLAQVVSKPKAPVSGSAWLDRMASDAGHQHVLRIGELRGELQKQAGKRDFSALASDLALMAQALPQLDFGLLQQKGLLARLSGKSKSAGAEFAVQYDRIEAAAEELLDQAKLLQGRQAEQAGGTDKALLEFEVEFRALDKIIDGASRWLQDMSKQLKEREAQGGDAAAVEQIRQDAQRCELLVGRLKLLRAVSSAAQHCQQQAQSAAARRASLVQALQNTVAGRIKQWRTRVTPLAGAAREGDAPTLSLEGPMDCHRDLQLCVKEAMADCAQLQSHEKVLAESLEALGAQVQAAAAVA
jgi:hypothetical protein